MSEMKTTLNVRITSDMNVSISFTALVDDEAEASAFGEQCAAMTNAWLLGYGSAAPEENA
jgi:hypothetical protein